MKRLEGCGSASRPAAPATAGTRSAGLQSRTPIAGSSSGPVLAIDPGRDKCGLAVVGVGGQILAREIVPPSQLAARAAACARRFPGARIVMGQGTGAREAQAALRAVDVSALPVQEEGT